MNMVGVSKGYDIKHERDIGLVRARLYGHWDDETLARFDRELRQEVGDLRMGRPKHVRLFIDARECGV